MADDDPTSGSRDTVNLEELRAEIKSIDREIVELIAQRTYVAETIAAVKEERGMATTDERQEARVKRRVAEDAERFDVDPDRVVAVFEILIELNKEEQEQVVSEVDGPTESS